MPALQAVGWRSSEPAKAGFVAQPSAAGVLLAIAAALRYNGSDEGFWRSPDGGPLVVKAKTTR